MKPVGLPIGVALGVLFACVRVHAQDTSTDQHLGMQMPMAAPGTNAPDAPAETSGTAWQPSAGPMHGVMGRARGWDLMAHGNLFAQFLFEGGEFHRRGHQLAASTGSWAWRHIHSRMER